MWNAAARSAIRLKTVRKSCFKWCSRAKGQIATDLEGIWAFFQEVSKWKEGNRQGVDGEKALKQCWLFVFILIWWERLPTQRGKEWKDWERYYWWNKAPETGEDRILHINGEISSGQDTSFTASEKVAKGVTLSTDVFRLVWDGGIICWMSSYGQVDSIFSTK